MARFSTVWRGAAWITVNFCPQDIKLCYLGNSGSPFSDEWPNPNPIDAILTRQFELTSEDSVNWVTVRPLVRKRATDISRTRGTFPSCGKYQSDRARGGHVWSMDHRDK